MLQLSRHLHVSNNMIRVIVSFHTAVQASQLLSACSITGVQRTIVDHIYKGVGTRGHRTTGLSPQPHRLDHMHDPRTHTHTEGREQWMTHYFWANQCYGIHLPYKYLYIKSLTVRVSLCQVQHMELLPRSLSKHAYTIFWKVLGVQDTILSEQNVPLTVLQSLTLTTMGLAQLHCLNLLTYHEYHSPLPPHS